MPADIEGMISEMQEILASDGRPPSNDDPGLTSAEWAAQWGMHQKTAALRLNAIKAAGRLVVGKRRIEGLDGRFRSIPVYAPRD